jgi:hypothetical protein
MSRRPTATGTPRGDVAELLTTKGVAADEKGQNQKTALNVAVERGNRATVKSPLPANASANTQSKGGTAPRYPATGSFCKGDVQFVGASIEHRVNLGADDAAGNRPIHRAVAAQMGVRRTFSKLTKVLGAKRDRERNKTDDYVAGQRTRPMESLARLRESHCLMWKGRRKTAIPAVLLGGRVCRCDVCSRKGLRTLGTCPDCKKEANIVLAVGRIDQNKLLFERLFMRSIDHLSSQDFTPLPQGVVSRV